MTSAPSPHAAGNQVGLKRRQTAISGRADCNRR